MGWDTTRYKRKGGVYVIDHNQTKKKQYINRENNKDNTDKQIDTVACKLLSNLSMSQLEHPPDSFFSG